MIVDVKQLTKKYGNVTAVKKVNFQINSREVVALLGVNGAGKTTILRMLTGILPATSGDIWINSVNLLDHSTNLDVTIGYLPETPSLYPDMRVADFLTHFIEYGHVLEIMRKKLLMRVYTKLI